MLAAANVHRISGQSSRANIDEEEEYEYDLSTPFPLTSSSMSASSSSSIDTCSMTPPITRKLEEISALFVHNNIAYGIADYLLEQGYILPFTTIKINDNSIYEVFISKSNQNSILFKRSGRLFNDREMSHGIKFLWELISFKEVIILDSLVAAKFIPNNEYDIDKNNNASIENLRVIRTENFENSDWLKGVHVGGPHKASILESGNIITGSTASILCSCELRNIPALALLCIREAAFDTKEARRFEEYWSIYCSKFLSLDSGQVINVPTVDIYNNLRRSDPFMLSTETLYT